MSIGRWGVYLRWCFVSAQGLANVSSGVYEQRADGRGRHHAADASEWGAGERAGEDWSQISSS